MGNWRNLSSSHSRKIIEMRELSIQLAPDSLISIKITHFTNAQTYTGMRYTIIPYPYIGQNRNRIISPLLLIFFGDTPNSLQSCLVRVWIPFEALWLRPFDMVLVIVHLKCIDFFGWWVFTWYLSWAICRIHALQPLRCRVISPTPYIKTSLLTSSISPRIQRNLLSIWEKYDRSATPPQQNLAKSKNHSIIPKL